MKKVINNIFFYLFLFFSFLIIFSASWAEKTFGLINLDSLIYHLLSPLEGTESTIFISFFTGPLLNSILILLVCLFIFSFKYIYKIFINIRILKFNITNLDLLNILYKLRLIFIFIIFLLSIFNFCKKFEVFEYIKNLSTYSKFIEKNYVEPSNAKINFSTKRNLIHIMVESLEYTFADKENGGAYEENLIPNLTKYADDEVSFTNPSGGGFINSRATGWTMAAMVAQTAGINFTVPGSGNDYGLDSSFLPGAYSLGEILEKEGYNQTLLIGSNANFAGRRSYFEQHGNYMIKDYVYALENEWIPKDYSVWWGYEDSKLFKFAKDELNVLADKEEPFNLTLLTANTHHIGGYLEEDCEIKYEEQLKNVVACTDNQIYEFVEWIKEQDFYGDTTIVITGDHLSMEPTFFNNLEDYERTNYNVFINANKDATKKENREFNTLDIYPTIIGSLGGDIKGNRLGLGTDLFSSTKTLYEEYGRSYVDNEYAKNSKYFKNHILHDLDT